MMIQLAVDVIKNPPINISASTLYDLMLSIGVMNVSPDKKTSTLIGDLSVLKNKLSFSSATTSTSGFFSKVAPELSTSSDSSASITPTEKTSISSESETTTPTTPTRRGWPNN